MYLLVVDQFLFALKSFKFSELSYCQNWDHKATQKKNFDWSLHLQFDFIRTALLWITTETLMHLMHVIIALQVHSECPFKM